MFLRSRLFFAVCALFCLLLFSCQKRASRYGTESTIVVIADDQDWQKIEGIVRETFEQEYFTPQPEKVFVIQRITPDELSRYSRWRNICIFATLQTSGKVGELVNSILPHRDRVRVDQDSSFVFRKIDPWASGQLLLLVVAKNMPTLQEQIKKNQELLFYLFDEHASNLVSKEMLPNAKSKELADKLGAEYGWKIQIQRDFFEAVNSPQDHFVWLRRLNPQRWIFVYWQKVEDPSLLNEEWMINTRNRLAEKYYQGDVIINKFNKVQDVDFLGNYAIRLDGHWENDSLNVGGAFREYGFYSQSSERLYLIDMAVYSPGERKLQYIRQLDAIAHTFQEVKP